MFSPNSDKRFLFLSRNKEETAADILYKNTNNAKKEEQERNNLLNELGDKLTPAQTLYSNINELKEIKKGTSTGGASGIGDYKTPISELQRRQSNENYMSTKPYSNIWDNDKDFKKAMEFVLKSEGGYSNRKEDRGGATNFGITQGTYNDYNKKHGLPTKDVKNITKDEALRIYYNDFWKKTGADKIKDKRLGLAYFDAAINHGPAYAKKFYNASGGDVKKYIQLRKDKYKNLRKDPSQQIFSGGWTDRINNLEKRINEEF